MKVVTWNINALGPTLRNIDLRHGSLTGFIDSLGADVVCLQVSLRVVQSQIFARFGQAKILACARLRPTWMNDLQETKLIPDKLTRDLVCISDEFEVPC